MATTIAPPEPLPDLEATLEWIESIKVMDLPLNEREFFVEVDGRSYRIAIPFAFEDPRKYWVLTVDDLETDPDRGTKWALGHQWEFEYAIDTVSADVSTFFN